MQGSLKVRHYKLYNTKKYKILHNTNTRQKVVICTCIFIQKAFLTSRIVNRLVLVMFLKCEKEEGESYVGILHILGGERELTVMEVKPRLI